jgi:hypothetical protein
MRPTRISSPRSRGASQVAGRRHERGVRGPRPPVSGLRAGAKALARVPAGSSHRAPSNDRARGGAFALRIPQPKKGKDRQQAVFLFWALRDPPCARGRRARSLQAASAPLADVLSASPWARSKSHAPRGRRSGSNPSALKRERPPTGGLPFLGAEGFALRSRASCPLAPGRLRASRRRPVGESLGAFEVSRAQGAALRFESLSCKKGKTANRRSSFSGR